MPTSATSEWYFNVHSNVSALDTPTTDSKGVTTSYTVFGKVLTGMNVVDQIAKLPTFNVSSSLNTVPVTGLSEGEAKKNFPITAANLVYTRSITSEPGTNFTVTSDNNALVTPKVTNGTLSFAFASGLSGTANITVLAKNLDGTSASATFAVTVPNSVTPSAGPVAANITAPNVVTGTTANINVLGSDTDSVAGLNPATVTIVTQPVHGTATVNTSTGAIAYNPTAGYTGPDSLTLHRHGYGGHSFECRHRFAERGANSGVDHHRNRQGPVAHIHSTQRRNRPSVHQRRNRRRDLRKQSGDNHNRGRNCDCHRRRNHDRQHRHHQPGSSRFAFADFHRIRRFGIGH